MQIALHAAAFCGESFIAAALASLKAFKVWRDQIFTSCLGQIRVTACRALARRPFVRHNFRHKFRVVLRHGGGKGQRPLARMVAGFRLCHEVVNGILQGRRRDDFNHLSAQG